MPKTLSDYLYDPDTKIISTWDVVITPYLSIRLDQARASSTNGHEPNQPQRPRMVGWSSPYYLISGIEHVASLLTPDREYLVTADIHELNADVWDLPHPLSQALDGYNQPDLYDADDTWQATIDGQYSVWMLAERFRLKLKTAKQAQGVKEALLGAGVDLPRTWSGALKALADAAPESMNHDLAEQFNRLS